MHKFFQKYGKVFMAILMCVLMVTFLLPMAGRGLSGGRGQAIGTVNGQPVYAVELDNARDTWQTLMRTPVGKDHNHLLVEMLPQEAVSQINNNALLFLLLEKEAQRMGVTVSEDQLNSVIINVPGLATGNRQHDRSIRAAVADLMTVAGAFDLAGEAVKVSQPRIEHDMAERMQSINLTVSEVNTAAYLDKVPAPTARQLKEQFEKYAGVIAGTVSDENPFGFGYKYPDRVKLQYIVIPRLDVRKIVEASKSPYLWTVDAQKYYFTHENEFPTTAPSTGKNFDLTPTSRPAGAATTKPFSDVAQQIKDQLIDNEVQQKAQQIQDYITTTMAGDYVAWHNTAGKTASSEPGSAAATQPAAGSSSLGPPYASLDYLKTLAASVQQQFKVMPMVVSLQDKWLDFEALANQAGIGQAHREEGISFNSYIIGLTAPFLAAQHRTETNTLQIMEPTQPMTDANDSIYIARVTAAEPSHAPAALSDVEAQVTHDVKTREAFDMAQTEARKLLDAAKQKGLADAAAAAKRSVVKVGPLTYGEEPVSALALTGESAARFTDQAFGLLTTPTSRPSGKPLELIRLQQDGRVFVAQLGEVQAMWNQENLPMARARVDLTARQQIMQTLAQTWFDYRSVKSRVNWQPNENYKESEPSENQPAPPPGPML